MIRLSGSFAVAADVSFFFMPPMRAQKDRFRGPPSGCGALRLPPVSRLYDARPLAFRPPDGFLPSARCHAGVMARLMSSRTVLIFYACSLNARSFKNEPGYLRRFRCFICSPSPYFAIMPAVDVPSPTIPPSVAPAPPPLSVELLIYRSISFCFSGVFAYAFTRGSRAKFFADLRSNAPPPAAPRTTPIGTE